MSFGHANLGKVFEELREDAIILPDVFELVDNGKLPSADVDTKRTAPLQKNVKSGSAGSATKRKADTTPGKDSSTNSAPICLYGQ